MSGTLQPPNRPTPLPAVSGDDFCAYCFAPLDGLEVVARKRRYCRIEHAEADARKTGDPAEFESPAVEVAADQEPLW